MKHWIIIAVVVVVLFIAWKKYGHTMTTNSAKNSNTPAQ